MDVRLLGPLRVTVHGRAVPLRGRRSRALLAVLCLHRGDVVSGSRAAEALWGDDLPAAAGNAVQARVSALRRVLAEAGADVEGLLRTVPGGYRLDLAADALDVHRYEQLVGAAAAAVVTRPADAAVDLDAAEDLWGGDPWADLADDGAARADAVRLAELRRRALADRVRVALTCGDVGGALARAHALVAAEPLDEDAAVLLATAQYRAGRAGDALATLRGLRERLGEQLGVDPGPAVQALQQAVLTHDETLDGPRRTTAARTGTAPQHDQQAPHQAAPARDVPALPRPRTSLVGREDDVRDVLDLLGRHPLVTLLGPGGTGKTRLALEVAARTAASTGDGPAPEVRLVELAGLSDPAAVLPAVGRALGLQALRGSPPTAAPADWRSVCRSTSPGDACSCCWTTASTWWRQPQARPTCCSLPVTT